LLEINKLAKRVTGTASTDMSVAAPALMLCLFSLLLELLSLMADILSVNQLLNIITSAFDTIIIVLLG
jgi:type III secretory pathway component EscT